MDGGGGGGGAAPVEANNQSVSDDRLRDLHLNHQDVVLLLFNVGWKGLQNSCSQLRLSTNEHTVKLENGYVFRQHYRTPSTAECFHLFSWCLEPLMKHASPEFF